MNVSMMYMIVIGDAHLTGGLHGSLPREVSPEKWGRNRYRNRTKQKFADNGETMYIMYNCALVPIYIWPKIWRSHPSSLGEALEESGCGIYPAFEWVWAIAPKRGEFYVGVETRDTCLATSVYNWNEWLDSLGFIGLATALFCTYKQIQ